MRAHKTGGARAGARLGRGDAGARRRAAGCAEHYPVAIETSRRRWAAGRRRRGWGKRFARSPCEAAGLFLASPEEANGRRWLAWRGSGRGEEFTSRLAPVLP